MRIDSYRFGEVVVDGRTYRSDVILFPDRVQDGWWRRAGHRLGREDLEEAILAGPDLLLIGTGCHGRMKVPERLVESLVEEGFEVLVLDTEKASEAYNRLSADRRVVGLFHLTC